jgi:hypothetical protein
VSQLGAERLENLVTRVRTVIGCKLVQRFLLGRLEKGPQMVLDDGMLRVCNLGLFKHPIAVLANQISRDVVLKGDLWGFLVRHDRSSSMRYADILPLFLILFKR